MHIAALGPDRCRFDRCAVCAYYHLRQQTLNGGRDKLSPDELEFVGVVSRRRDTTGGWHQPITTYEIDSLLSREDTALLPALMNAGNAERVEFMG